MLAWNHAVDGSSINNEEPLPVLAGTRGVPNGGGDLSDAHE